MELFMIRFLSGSLLLGGIILVFFAIRKLLGKVLGAQNQYRLWLVLFLLLSIPFLPRFSFSGPAFSLAEFLPGTSSPISPTPSSEASLSSSLPDGAVWMKDFAVSVSRRTPAGLWSLLFLLWAAGVLLMLFFLVRSALCMRRLRHSALPLQHPEAKRLYASCLKELNIRRRIPVYSTAFLKSPVMSGVFFPKVYLPIHLVSDYQEEDLRYIFLHELTHFRHRDPLIGWLMNLSSVLYWFHPLVRAALGAMRSDRELSCDEAVLSVLPASAYPNYGHVLIRFAGQTSFQTSPFTASLSGNKSQLRNRIFLIASYQRPSARSRRKGFCAFLAASLLLFSSAPVLSAASGQQPEHAENSAFSSGSEWSSYFQGTRGSFVLYDPESGQWRLFNENLARTRISPDSTYKIYCALSALDSGIITPEESALSWSGETYPFEEWNQDQTLSSAMSASVNWYFQELDARMGRTQIRSFLHRIGYGNEDAGGDLSSYWMESSLKISPVEQVELLVSFYQNKWGLDPSCIQAVKDAMLLSSSSGSSLYGKTGTGQVNGRNRNGWFVGFVESAYGHPYFFAANLQGEGASGSKAVAITLSILSEAGIYSDPS